MKFTDLLAQYKNREPLDVLVDGTWVRAALTRLETYGGIGGLLGGTAWFRQLVSSGGCYRPTQPEIQISGDDVPRCVRLPLDGRTLTADEVDRYCDAASHTIAIGVAELNELARTAKAVANYPAELERLRAQVKSLEVDRDMYKKQALDRAEVLAEIGDTLTATGFAKNNTKYTDTIKALNAQRQSDALSAQIARSDYQRGERLLKISGENYANMTAQRDAARAELAAVDKTLGYGPGINTATRVGEIESWKRTRNETHANYVRADQERTEANRARDEARRERDVAVRDADRRFAEYLGSVNHQAAAIDALNKMNTETERQRDNAAKQAAGAAKKLIETEDRLTEVTKSMADANAKLRTELEAERVNWRKHIPGDVLERLTHFIGSHQHGWPQTCEELRDILIKLRGDK